MGKRKHEREKQKLITYNMDDCFALQTVQNAVSQISSQGEKEKQIFEVTSIDEIIVNPTYKFGKIEFVIDEFELINQCAYFNYQREKVYLRFEKKPKAKSQKKKKLPGLRGRINKVEKLPFATECPQCGSSSLYKHGNVNKIVYDLRISDYGVKRWTVKHCSKRFHCRSCGYAFTPQLDFFNQRKYGWGLLIWIVYQIVALRQTYVTITENIQASFGLKFETQICTRSKHFVSQYYHQTYEKILKNLVQGDLIQADETTCKIRKVKNYIWVISSFSDVYFFFSPSREGDKIQELLDGFTGVLVSDFYGAYDSIPCKKQRCLIHLIRDMNDDLRNNPFDDEFKTWIRAFSELLQEIVLTIDKYGLKRRNLNKHKKQVDRLFKENLDKNCQSQIVQSYQKRFRKYRDQLFTFLDFDGIPWNNNNAEHAIKAFALYRKVNNGYYTEKGIKDYLILLSIYQTCIYRGLDFLKFMRSQQTDIDEYCRELGKEKKM